jgi:hypothetical protein
MRLLADYSVEPPSLAEAQAAVEQAEAFVEAVRSITKTSSLRQFHRKTKITFSVWLYFTRNEQDSSATPMNAARR